MRNKSLWLAALAMAGAAAAFSTPASADPVGGALIGGGIGAAVAGPPGAAVGAVIGSIIGSAEHRHYRHGRHYDRGYYAPPVAYVAPPRVAYVDRSYYEPRYREARNYEPRRYDDRRYDQRRYDDRRYDDRRYDDRRDFRDERQYQRDEYAPRYYR